MIDFLLGVPGKLKTISDYLTGTLYPYITSRTAYLDTTVSSRAAASTALTNATWTDTRAAKLDTVLLTSAIQSVQTGRISGSYTVVGSGSTEDCGYKDVTITSVNTAKAIVLLQDVGFNQTGVSTWRLAKMTSSARLTSATNLRIAVSGSFAEESAAGLGSTDNMSARWIVLEFK